MTVMLPFNSTVAPNWSARPAGGGDAVVAGRRTRHRPNSPACGVSTVGALRLVEQVGVRGQDGQRVGVDDHGQIGVQCEPQRRGADVVGAKPRPDYPGLHPTRAGR